ncbi:MAG: DUF177 domain-containing protein [Victivallaceae bacterium]|nr:DUF177 domain-containing protein [Victivallaceae bacterium]
MIKISVSRLQKEPIRLEGTEPPAFLDLSDGQFTVVSPMEYAFDVRAVSGNALVSGVCRVTVEGVCGRCLKTVRRTVETEKLQLLFPLDGIAEELDLGEDVRAAMVLALPMNLVCGEDCAGVCPACGADRNDKFGNDDFIPDVREG